MNRALLLALALASSSACYRTRMVFRQAPMGPISNEYDGRWHHGGVLGLVEFSDPVALDRACPGGVAGIEQRTSFLNGLAANLTGSLYTPQSVTVECMSTTATPRP